MNLSFYIARRYIFSKKSHQVINIISGVAISGVALATAAMVCVLSVFNGFQSVVAGQFSAMYLKINSPMLTICFLQPQRGPHALHSASSPAKS
jgi:ABC-type lipoprotein release transport system permease subunit